MSQWEMVKLGKVYDIGSSKRVFQSEWKEEGVPFYRAREIVKLAENGYVNNKLFINEEMYNNYSVKYGVPNADDIMVTGVGTIGICYIVKEHDKFYFKDGNILWLKKKAEVNSFYIAWLFKSNYVKEQIRRQSSGTTVGTFTITTAKSIEIPLPPIEIQQKIAKTLDTAAALMKLRKQQLAELDQLIQSVFYEMFGDPVINEKGWETGVIRDVVADVKYGTSKPAVEGGKYTYLRMNNITYDGHLDLTSLKYIDIPDKEVEKYIVRRGDVLFNRTIAKN